MGLFDTTTDNRTPAQRIAEQVKVSARQQASAIAREYEMNYRRIWTTPNVDPKDVVAALGTDAGELFGVTNQTMVLAGRGAELKSIPAKYSYTVNPDGSITLTDVAQPVGSE